MTYRQLSLVFALVGILASPEAPRAGELHATYGSPQMRTIWQNDSATERKMTVDVSPAGGAICTVSASGGSTKRYDTDKGKPQTDDITVPGKGTISITASDSGVRPKPAKGGAPVASSATCTYSVSESRDLSR